MKIKTFALRLHTDTAFKAVKAIEQLGKMKSEHVTVEDALAALKLTLASVSVEVVENDLIG